MFFFLFQEHEINAYPWAITFPSKPQEAEFQSKDCLFVIILYKELLFQSQSMESPDMFRLI